MAAATKTRSPKSVFQPAEGGSLIVNRKGAIAPGEDDKGYADTRFIEYINPEQTVAVVSMYRDFAVVVKTDLTPEQVLDAESYTMTNEGYADTRARGVWVTIKDDISAKTHARRSAEALLAQIQDVQAPVVVSLDGKFAPALTIARTKWESEHEYYGERKRRAALADLAQEAGVDLDLLDLAVKEDRLVWSTPPVAPKSVIVVVKETATGNLTERLVDEIVLASGEVEGLGRIAHTGGVSEYLVALREREIKASVAEIVKQREQVKEGLEAIQSRVTGLLADLDKGETLGRGWHDGLRVAELAEKAQNAAAAYHAAVVSADLPGDYAEALRKGEFFTEDRYRYTSSDVRAALKALAALNGMSLDRDDCY